MESLARVSARCVNEKCLETEKEKCIRQDSVGNLLVPISVGAAGAAAAAAAARGAQ